MVFNKCAYETSPSERKGRAGEAKTSSANCQVRYLLVISQASTVAADPRLHFSTSMFAMSNPRPE